jgi:hypothetical protein
MIKETESTFSKFEENQLKLNEKKSILGGFTSAPPATKEPINAPVSSQNNGDGGLPHGWVDPTFQGQQP